MPIGAQPRGRRGTVGHPYSPLNLRLGLATFGLVVCTVFGVFALWAGLSVLGWFLVALAVVAVVDLVVIQLRRRAAAQERSRSDDHTGHQPAHGTQQRGDDR